MPAAMAGAAEASAQPFDPAKGLHEAPFSFAGAVNLYDDWAFCYDDTLLSWGYDAHLKVAELLAKYSSPEKAGTKDAPLMDCGCGTGLSGEAVAELGFRDIVGTDCSIMSLKQLFQKTVVSVGQKDKIECVDIVNKRNVEEAVIPLVSAKFSGEMFKSTDITGRPTDTTVRLGNTSIPENSSVTDATNPDAVRRCLYSSVALCNLEEPFTYEDSTFGALICVGVTSYVMNFTQLWGEVVRICKPGAIVVFTIRPALWDPDEKKVQSAAKALDDAGKWKQVYMSEPSSYMPKNPVEEQRLKTIYYCVYEVTK